MNTTRSPEGGDAGPAGTRDPRAGVAGPGTDRPGRPGHGGYDAEPLGEYGYTGGYGPGYGDPDGGGGYSYGPGYEGAEPGYGDAGLSYAGLTYAGAGQGYGYAGPGEDEPPGGPGDWAGPAGQQAGAAGPPAPGPGGYEPAVPVVAATPALRGYPGGPGLDDAGDDDQGGPAARAARGLRSPSVWQSAQRAWRDSGVEWQRPVADYEPAEAEWERVRTAPPAKRRGTARPPGAGRTGHAGPPGPARQPSASGPPASVGQPSPPGSVGQPSASGPPGNVGQPSVSGPPGNVGQPSASGPAGGAAQSSAFGPAAGIPPSSGSGPVADAPRVSASGHPGRAGQAGERGATRGGHQASRTGLAGRLGLAGRPGPASGTGPASRPATPRGSRQAGRPAGGAFGVRRGWWLIVLAIVVVAALVAAGFALFGGGGKAGSATGPQYPAATPAGADFATHPAELGRGIFHSVTAVADAGGTVVAAAAEAGQWLPRAEFLVSADGGRHWQLAAVRSGRGAALVPPQLLAAGPGGWLALGAGATWTSRDARTWTLAAGHGIAPVQAGDHVAALAGTSSGYIAVGYYAPKGSPGLLSPVMWTSQDGLTWQRLSAATLGLPVPRGARVLRLSQVVARGTDVIISGSMLAPQGTGKHRTSAVISAVWQSSDAGRSWTAAGVPVSPGTANTLDGIAATAAGFVAIRPGSSKASGADAVAYTSRTGTAWAQGGTITAPKPANLRITLVGGGSQGVVASGQVSGGTRVAYESADGSTWRSVASPGSSAQMLTAVTVTTGGTVVAAGSTVPGPAGQAPYLVLAGPDPAARVVSFARIPGATGPALSVNALTVAGGRQVAVGAANGLPAIWSAAGGAGQGQPWTPASSAALRRPGLSTLTGVAHGGPGWVAVGATVSGAPVAPIVLGSANGTSWQAADGESAFAGPGVTLHQVAAGRSGYVIVGQQAVPATTTTTTTGSGRHKKTIKHVVRARTVAAAWWSAGLTGWTRAAGLSAGSGPRQMAAVAADGTGFVAVGSDANFPAAWISANGRTWQFIQLGPPTGASAASLQHVAVLGKLIVATGTQTTPAGTAPFAEYTTDGGTLWQQEPLSAPGGPAAVTALTTAGRGVVAAGTVGRPGHQRVVVWWSTDGFAWRTILPRGTGLSGPGSQAITALAASGTALTGAGYTATPMTEQPTLWHATAGP